MKINLREKNDDNKEYVGVNIYSNDKLELDAIANKHGVSLAVVLRTAINNLIDEENA